MLTSENKRTVLGIRYCISINATAKTLLQRTALTLRRRRRRRTLCARVMQCAVLMTKQQKVIAVRQRITEATKTTTATNFA